MRKLMTIFGAVLFAGAVLTSCGADPEADAQSLKDCYCAATDLEGDEQDKKRTECSDLATKQQESYKEDEENKKKYEEAVKKAQKEDCK